MEFVFNSKSNDNEPKIFDFSSSNFQIEITFIVDTLKH